MPRLMARSWPNPGRMCKIKGMTRDEGCFDARHVVALAQDLVRIDSRSARFECHHRRIASLRELRWLRGGTAGLCGSRRGWPKCVLVAAPGRRVDWRFPAIWTLCPTPAGRTDPWSGRIEGGRRSARSRQCTDMKGPMAALHRGGAGACRRMCRCALLITTDEETTKQGAKLIADDGPAWPAPHAPRGIVVAEPTLPDAGAWPSRAHRVLHRDVADGRAGPFQPPGSGRNANWGLVAVSGAR